MTSKSITELLAPIRERLERATPGPWVWGDWTIRDKDRKAQKRQEPYWTLVEPGNMNLSRGPIGRKDIDITNIASGCGYDESDINIKPADADFIANAPTDIAKLIAAVECLGEALADISEDFTCALEERAQIALTEAKSILGGGEE